MAEQFVSQVTHNCGRDSQEAEDSQALLHMVSGQDGQASGKEPDNASKSPTERAVESEEDTKPDAPGATTVVPKAKTAPVAVKAETSPQGTSKPAEPKDVECLKRGLSKPVEDCVKKSKKYICKPCNSAASMLSKAIEGGFDGKAFGSLPESEQQRFWQNASGASKRDLVAQYESKLRAVQTDERSQGEGGDFLPLSVWETRGYDTDRIKRLTPPEDRRDHPVLGETFRVVVEWKAETRSQKLEEDRTAHTAAQLGLCRETSVDVAKEATAKGRTKTPAQQAKEAAKIEAQNTKLWAQSSKVVAAIAPVLAQHGRTMSGNSAWTGSDWHHLREKWAELQSMLSEAQRVIDGYQKNRATPIDKDMVPQMAQARSKIGEFIGGLKALIPKKPKKS